MLHLDLIVRASMSGVQQCVAHCGTVLLKAKPEVE